MFNRGANEIVVGKGLLKEFEGFEPGKTVTFATSRWTVVGTFEAEGSVFESEIWADLNVVFDCADPDRLARFWATALPDYHTPPPPDGRAA